MALNEKSRDIGNGNVWHNTKEIVHAASIGIASINGGPLPSKLPSNLIRNVRTKDVLSINLLHRQIWIVNA